MVHQIGSVPPHICRQINISNLTTELKFRKLVSDVGRWKRKPVHNKFMMLSNAVIGYLMVQWTMAMRKRLEKVSAEH